MSAPTAGPAERRPGARRRAREASLLVWALVVVLLAGVLLLGAQPVSTWPVALAPVFALAAVAGGVHGAVRLLAPTADPLLVPLTVLLNGLGLVLIRRVDIAQGTSYATNQLVWTVLGWSVFVVVLAVVRDHRSLTRLSYTFGLLTIVLIALPLLPVIGREINGARLWIDVGPVRAQPGELAKITLVVFLAGYLDRTRAILSIAQQRVGPLLLPAPRHLGPLLTAVGLALLVLVFQRDLGSSLLLFGIVVITLHVATGRIAYAVVGLGAFAVGAALAFRLFGHLRDRVAIWLDPFADPFEQGYQLVQVQFAFANGGLTGTGLGLGSPATIPFAHTDAIFAVAGEELGILGATGILVAFLLFVERGMRIAVRARDDVGTLFAVGLTAIIALQVFVIVGGLTRVIPLTGIVLPFVSYGGSALVTNLALVALLLRVDDDTGRGPLVPTRRPRPESTTVDEEEPVGGGVR